MTTAGRSGLHRRSAGPPRSGTEPNPSNVAAIDLRNEVLASHVAGHRPRPGELPAENGSIEVQRRVPHGQKQLVTAARSFSRRSLVREPSPSGVNPLMTSSRKASPSIGAFRRWVSYLATCGRSSTASVCSDQSRIWSPRSSIDRSPCTTRPSPPRPWAALGRPTCCPRWCSSAHPLRRCRRPCTKRSRQC